MKARDACRRVGGRTQEYVPRKEEVVIYYGTAQVADILGGEFPLRQVTVQKLCMRGAFPHADRDGRVWLIPECDLTPELRARYAHGARPKGGRPRKNKSQRAA